jgi:hypothetical protein
MALTFSFPDLNQKEFKTYAIIVDNTDGPNGNGTMLATSLSASGGTYACTFTSNSGHGSCTVNLPADAYSFQSCILGYTGSISSFTVVSDSSATVSLHSGSCPF